MLGLYSNPLGRLPAPCGVLAISPERKTLFQGVLVRGTGTAPVVRLRGWRDTCSQARTRPFEAGDSGEFQSFLPFRIREFQVLT